MRKVYKYWRTDAGQTIDDSYECNSYASFPEGIAEACALDFFNNHDGWDCRWPLVFCVAKENDEMIGTFEIESRIEPVFKAWKVEQEEGSSDE